MSWFFRGGGGRMSDVLLLRGRGGRPHHTFIKVIASSR